MASGGATASRRFAMIPRGNDLHKLAWIDGDLSSIFTATSTALSAYGLIVQNDAQQLTVDFNVAGSLPPSWCLNS
jgi:hypothetical protein